MEEAGGGNRGDSTGTVTSSQRLGSRSFSETTLTKGRRGQVGVRGRGLSPWKHPPWSITSRVGQSTRGQKEQQTMAGPVFNTSSVSFFSFFFKIFLLFNCRFFGSSVVFFRSLFSSASLKYSHTGNQKCLCLVCQDATNKKIKNQTEGKKKALHIYIKKFWGDSTFFFFSGSPHSLHTWVSHGSVFWWSVTWLVIFWSPSVQIWKQVCRNESSLTVLTGGDGDWSPASGAGSLVSVSVRVIN